MKANPLLSLGISRQALDRLEPHQVHELANASFRSLSAILHPDRNNGAQVSPKAEALLGEAQGSLDAERIEKQIRDLNLNTRFMEERSAALLEAEKTVNSLHADSLGIEDLVSAPVRSLTKDDVLYTPILNRAVEMELCPVAIVSVDQKNEEKKRARKARSEKVPAHCLKAAYKEIMPGIVDQYLHSPEAQKLSGKTISRVEDAILGQRPGKIPEEIQKQAEKWFGSRGMQRAVNIRAIEIMEERKQRRAPSEEKDEFLTAQRASDHLAKQSARFHKFLHISPAGQIKVCEDGKLRDAGILVGLAPQHLVEELIQGIQERHDDPTIKIFKTVDSADVKIMSPLKPKHGFLLASEVIISQTFFSKLVNSVSASLTASLKESPFTNMSGKEKRLMSFDGSAQVLIVERTRNGVTEFALLGTVVRADFPEG